MITAVGILLLVAGAIFVFAVERQVEGVDLQLVGWIVMGGGGLALFVAFTRAAALDAASEPAVDVHPERHEERHST